MSARLLKDPATISSRIFVGHLQTDDMTKHELEEHFSKYGVVVGSLINRGFGFVQFEDELSAQNAIQNENGAMFKGRRIDVKPAKKENNGGTSQGNTIAGVKQNNQFNSGSNNFSANNSFAPGNQSFNNTNPPTGTENQFSGQKATTNIPNQFNETNQNNGNDQFPNQKPGNTNEQFNNSNQNKPASNQFNATNQQPNFGGNQNKGGRPRGTRGGKNKHKNRENAAVNNFRDRSPINRAGRQQDKGALDWDMKQADRLRANSFGREAFNDGVNRYDDFKSAAVRDMNMSFGNTSGSADYPASEKNDCEIIVVDKASTEYAEAIESRLKKIGLTVDLLFPNDDVLLSRAVVISRVLANIANRGCLYAVVVTPVNQEHHSLTLNILHGLPQEHRNMPVEDAINLISRDFANYKAGRRSIPINTPLAKDRHPDAIQVLLNMLAENRQLTVLQYERVIKYLEIKREEQVQVELGDAKDLPPTTLPVSDPKQVELQSRILNILNSNKPAPSAPVPSPVPAPTPTPVPPATWGTAASSSATSTTTTTATTGVSPSPLLNDPTVQKALDSLLQGNLLKSIGDQQQSTTPTAPLFAAFPNIGRF